MRERSNIYSLYCWRICIINFFICIRYCYTYIYYTYIICILHIFILSYIQCAHAIIILYSQTAYIICIILHTKYIFNIVYVCTHIPLCACVTCCIIVHMVAACVYLYPMWMCKYMCVRSLPYYILYTCIPSLYVYVVYTTYYTLSYTTRVICTYINMINVYL